MTDLRQAAQQALEALEVATNCLDGYYIPRGKTTLPEIEDAITALKAALAEPVEPVEPVAWTLTKTLTKRETTTNGYLWFSDPVNSSWTPLYAHPPQRKPLTEEEIQAAWDSVDMRHPRGNETRIAFARAIERAHGIE